MHSTRRTFRCTRTVARKSSVRECFTFAQGAWHSKIWPTLNDSVSYFNLGRWSSPKTPMATGLPCTVESLQHSKYQMIWTFGAHCLKLHNIPRLTWKTWLRYLVGCRPSNESLKNIIPCLPMGTWKYRHGASFQNQCGIDHVLIQLRSFVSFRFALFRHRRAQKCFQGGAKSTFCLSFSGCLRCNANERMQKRKCPMLRQQLHTVFSL